MDKITLTFRPKQKTKKLLKGLEERARHVLVHRFGLEHDGQKRTLESIGEDYDITRERVRQIENAALEAIRESESFTEAREIFDELKEVVDGMGGVVSEEYLLTKLSSDKVTQNHLRFYLTLANHFTDHKETKHYKKRWVTRHDIADKLHDALEAIYKELSKKDLLSEEDMMDRVRNHDHLEDIHDKHKTEDVLRGWLSVANSVRANALSQWGRHDSPNISARGIRDYAFLVMRQHGGPMHFTEVANSITELFGKKAHTATCHNELIKDSRFVLVGRGLYALKEWGYKSGVVKDIITEIIKNEGPLPKDEIVDKVLRERYLKKNTIMVNLQNPRYFKKDENGLYYIV